MKLIKKLKSKLLSIAPISLGMLILMSALALSLIPASKVLAGTFLSGQPTNTGSSATSGGTLTGTAGQGSSSGARSRTTSTKTATTTTPEQKVQNCITLASKGTSNSNSLPKAKLAEIDAAAKKEYDAVKEKLTTEGKQSPAQIETQAKAAQAAKKKSLIETACKDAFSPGWQSSTGSTTITGTGSNGQPTTGDELSGSGNQNVDYQPGEARPYSDQLADSLRLSNPSGLTDITGIASKLINWLLLILSMVAVIMILYAAILLVFNAGNDQRVAQGKKTMTWAVIGLVVSLGAFALVNLIQGVL